MEQSEQSMKSLQNEIKFEKSSLDSSSVRDNEAP